MTKDDESPALVPIDTARSVPPGPVHPATGTTCTRCGQVIQSVLPAFPPVETVDGWRHERCREVLPEPVPVDARPSETLSDLLRWQPTAAEVQAAQLPAAPASEPAVRPLSAELAADLSTLRKGKPVDLDVYVDRIAALEAELADEKAAHDMTRDAVKTAVDCENAARAEVEQLRGKLAEAEGERDRAKDAFEHYRIAGAVTPAKGGV